MSGFFIVDGLLALVLSVIALVDVTRHPQWAWDASGQNKTLWLVLNIVGIFVCGIIISLVYLLAIRPKVARAEQGGIQGGYGTPVGFGSAGGYGNQGGYAPPPPGYSPDQGGWNTPPPPPAAVSAPPAGWYPDPSGNGGQRYWNGSAWTDNP